MKKENKPQQKPLKIDIKKLSPYQKYVQSKMGGNDKKRYFDFYNDVKHSTHQIYDW